MGVDPAWLSRVLARLDAEEIAETTSALVATPSVSGTPAERAGLDQVGRWLGERGVEVRPWSVTPSQLSVPDGWSCEVERREVVGLVASVGPGDGPGLLVNAHVDVVPAAEQAGWSGSPFVPWRDGGDLVGRGVADTKGGLAAAMHVLAALAAEADDLPGRLVLAPVVGEEDGGVGTLASLDAGLRVSAAVVVEPTDLEVAAAAAGALRFRVRVPGVTAHGSVRHQGVSAIEKGWLVHRALLDLEAARAARLSHPLVETPSGAPTPWPVCIGRIEGGAQPCDVADLLVLDGRLGVAPHERPDDARGELERAVARACATDSWLADHPAQVEWVGAQWWPSDTPGDDPVVEAFCAAGGVAPSSVPYGCDAGLLRHVGGLPSVIVGPGLIEQAHAPDERVAVSDLGRFAELLARGAARWWAAVAQ